MPLLDHFRGELIDQDRHWESFHATWCAEMMGHLNKSVLPSGYFAEVQAHAGSRVEVDVPTFERARPETAPDKNGPSGVVATEVWAPPKPAQVMPAVFPDEFAVQVFGPDTGRSLVAAVEMVSPGNKDRPETRAQFAAKCAAYLQIGVGLIVVDITTRYSANLHDVLLGLLHKPEEFRFPTATPLYTVAYRPARRDPAGDQIDLWKVPLELGQGLPVMPLALRGGPTLPLDLEATYTEARLRSRL